MNPINVVLGWVPAWVWAGLLATALAAGCMQRDRAHRLELKLTELKAEVAKDEAKRQAAALVDEQAQRTEEARRADNTRKAIEDAQEKSTLALADAGAARTELGRMREHAARLAAACSTPRGNPAPAQGGAAAADPGVVLADLLGRIGERAQGLAQLADARGIAGSACQNYAEGLKDGSGTHSRGARGNDDLPEPPR